VVQGVLARRAAGLSTAFPAPHFPQELDPGVIAFDSGFASPRLLPELSQFALNALAQHREEVLQYAPPQGQPMLRAWIADYMNQDGCDLTADNILIVNGAKHGIDLICRLLLDEGDAIVVTAPTYFTCIPIFRSFGAELLEVGQDEHGFSVAELEDLLAQRRRDGLSPPKLIYNVADFHNPTGVSMSQGRRQALVDVAARHGIPIVEDNPYRRVRFEGEPIPTLKALDRGGNVLHVGTFSKLVAPGLRVGWVAAPAEVIARLMQLKSDGGSCPLMQRIILDFCRSGAFAAHVARVQATYREHRDRMIAAVQRWLPEASFTVPEGGYYVWLTLPAHIDGDELARRAAARGVNIIPGTKFFARQEGYPSNHGPRRNAVRLSYSYASPAEIDEGVERLGEAYASMAA
jgi:2-aminoadipate transaminase